jgi:hypothetical protein
MRKIRNSFLILLGMMLTFGIAYTPVNAQKIKRPKNTGMLTVRTSPSAYSVRVDGEFMGMSGTDTPAEFYMPPGNYQLEVEFPSGKMFTRNIEIVRDKKNCICLSYVENQSTRECPYDVRVDGPDDVVEGDLITFVASNSRSDSPNPLNYVWTVSPASAKITSGLGTSAITVDTAGIGDQTVTAYLDVSDGLFDAKCRQKDNAPTIVKTIPQPKPYKIDEFISTAPDDDKARLDSFAIALQNEPDSQGYIILYQGTDRDSMRNKKVEVLGKRALDYLVKNRGIDPRRIVITNWGNRVKTTYELWIIPPGASPPVPE